MTRLSVLEDAKVKIAAYENMTIIDPQSEIIYDLVMICKSLVKEVEDLQLSLHAQEWEKEDWKDFE